MEISEHLKAILSQIGENPEREGLVKTPERFEKALEFLTQGYHQSPDDIVGDAIFTEECNHMVIVRDPVLPTTWALPPSLPSSPSQ